MIRRIATGTTICMTAASMLLVAACNGDGSRDEIGGVSASEAQALNDAAEMLDNRATSTKTDPKKAR